MRFARRSKRGARPHDDRSRRGSAVGGAERLAVTVTAGDPGWRGAWAPGGPTRRRIGSGALAAAIGLGLVAGPATASRPKGEERSAEPAPIAVTLLGTAVEWRAAPGTTVRGRLLGAPGSAVTSAAGAGSRTALWASIEAVTGIQGRAGRRSGAAVAGTLLGQGRATADGDGYVRITFYDAVGAAVVIEPGSTIELEPDAAETPFTFAVPDLAADVDPGSDRVVGRAPPGAELRLVLRDVSGDPVIERDVRAGSDGRVDIALGSEVDVVPGHTGGLMLVDDGGSRFEARFAPLRLDVRLGAREIVARATLGTSITASVHGSDGRLKGILSGRVAAGAGATETDETALSGALTGPVESGDVVSATREGGLLDARLEPRPIPELTVAIEPTARRIVGRGPPSTTLSLVALGPLGEHLRAEVETNIGGAFETAVSDELGAGWRAELAHDDGDGVRASALALAPQVVASVHGSVVYGIDEPGRPIRVTLRGPDTGPGPGPGSTGAISDSWTVPTSADGTFRLVLARRGASGEAGGGGGGGGAWRLRPGDVLEIDLAGGDPIVMRIPELAARTDPDTETVGGTAEPGADLRLVVETGSAPASGGGTEVPARSGPRRIVARASRVADADGRFDFDVGTIGSLDGLPLDIEVPMSGRIRAQRADGHAYEIGWAPLTVHATMGQEGVLQGSGAAGRDVSVVLDGADGRRIVATGRRETAGGSSSEPFWFAELRDEVGEPVPILPGDRLSIRVGDDEADVQIPRIDGVVHVSDDLVSGQAEPGLRLDARLFGLDGSSVTSASDTLDDGSFLFDFGSAGHDIRFNSTVVLSTEIGRHAFSRAIDGPGLSIDLVEGTVGGSAEPGQTVEIELVRGAGPIARHEFVAPRGGAFQVAFERFGERLVPREGDVVQLRLDAGPTRDRLIRLDVPALEIEHDEAADLAWGRITPGGRLELRADQAVPRDDEGAWAGEARAEIGTDGSYVVAFENAAFDLRPGTALLAWLHLPSGHYVTSRRVVPIVSAQIGGSTLCGWAAGAGVEVGLEAARPGADGGTERAAASARSARDGSFSSTVTPASGAGFAVRAGDRVTAELGGTRADFTVPPLEVEIDRSADRLRIATRPGAALMLSWPLGACGGGYLHRAWEGAALTADSDGVADIPLSAVFPQLAGPDAPRGAVAEIGLFEPSGHRIFVPIRPPMLEIHIGTPLVTGWTAARETAELVLVAPDGSERATASPIAGDDGRIGAHLLDGEREPVASRAGDRLIHRPATPGWDAEISLEPLAFEFDPASGLAGITTPHREVIVDLSVDPPTADATDGRPRLRFALTADAEGRFALPSPPTRADWAFDDVAELRLTIAAGDGHVIAATFLRPPRLGPGWPVFLPLVADDHGFRTVE